MICFITLSLLLTTAFAAFAKRDSNWDYVNDKINGISLGGWFLIEPFISPSLFEQFGDDESKIPVDEYAFTAQLGKEEAARQLGKHWDSWISKDDFKDIKDYGFNLVRIPIGYWAFFTLDDDPYVQGQEKYFDQALEWAAENDLKVWFDLHGLPGSQNGFDNSGKRGDVDWQKTKENIELSYKTLDYIYGKYGGDNYTDTIIGIEIVNEPLSPKLDEKKLLQFYYTSYETFRDEFDSENTFVLQEAFQPIGYWNEHFNKDYKNVSSKYTNFTDFHDIIFDHHHYEIFTVDQLKKSSNMRSLDIRNYARSIGETQKYHPSLVGEWSGAITDCAKWLNGVGTGARYDNTFNESQLVANSPPDNSKQPVFFNKKNEDQSSARNCSDVLNYDDFSDQHKADIRKFIEIQLVEYTAQSSGWIFWNYKTENAIEWSFKDLSKEGLFPKPFDNYRYFFSNGSVIEDVANSASIKGISHKASAALIFAYLIITLGTL
jgi:glucan 1,3-beta-glucosidase